MRGYIILSVVFAGVSGIDLILAVLSIKKRNILGRYLGLCCAGAAFVTLSYLASVFVEDYFLYSVLSSLYFIGIDVTLFALMHFMRNFTHKKAPCTIQHSWKLKLLTAYTIFDMVVLAINPFHEIAIHYIYEQTTSPHYGYSVHFLYQMHLLLAYIYILVILVYLLQRLLAVPSVYRRQYSNSIAILILIVLINAFYLYYQSIMNQVTLDYSLLGYSIAASLFYWNSFIYSTEDMLNQLRNHIFASLGQGILLFDYENELILENEKAKEMFADTFWRQEPTIEDLLKLLKGRPKNVINLSRRESAEKLSFHCYPSVGQHIRPLRCDYSPLLSRRGEVLGRLFVFSNLSAEYDILTGFHDWETFQRQSTTPTDEDTLITVAVCDINGLTNINRDLGHTRGDQAIQALAQRMREGFPPDTVFIRGQEAILAAICPGVSEEQTGEILEKIAEDAREDLFGGKPLSFQSAVQRIRSAESLADAVQSATEMLRTRKLLDENSNHSALLYSLVQALKECDSDTEAHVRRTQNLSAKLGKRIGLTAEEQSNLALLAILHDIGKIGIPLDILNKPGKLTDAEWEVLKSHVEKGYQITSSAEELQGIADMVLYHHERWDGKGYPDGLSKETIPLLSRIIAVVDAYDAMVNDRSYRKSMSKEAAMAELRRCAGTQFDPTIVSEFLLMLREDQQDEEARIYTDMDGDDARAEAELKSTLQATNQATRKTETASSSPEGDRKEELQQWSLEAPKSVDESDLDIHVMQYSRYVLNADQEIIEADENFERLTGYSQDDIKNGTLKQMDLIFEEDREEYNKRVMTETGRHAAAWIEHRIRRKSGSSIFVFCYGRIFYDSAKRRELTEIIICDSRESHSLQSVVRMEQNKALRRLERWENKYRRDPLTGLLNHEAFKNDVETRLLAGQHQAMMLMIDVDHFKEYNDTYGHRAGDEFLIMVAQALLGTLRKDDFACRMGGDEFAVILFFRPDVSRDRMSQRAIEICDKVNLMLTSSKQGGTSLSMGGAFLGENCATFDQLYEAADQALYRSKESGREQVSF